MFTRNTFMKIICFLVISIFLASCSPVSTVQENTLQQAPALLPTDTLPPKETGCGDGICDEMEKTDENLCPQDCQTEVQSSPIPLSDNPAYEPPINVFLVLHTDEKGEQGMESFTPDQGIYQISYDEIDWLMEEAEKHNLHITSLYNGWFTKWALDGGDLSQFEQLLTLGHEIGSEAHVITYDPVSNSWIYQREAIDIYGRPNYDPQIARQCWEDSSSQIDKILAKIDSRERNQIMCSTALSLSDERNLMNEFNLSIAVGNRLEAGANYLGHMPWNPWRAANVDDPGYEVAEDLSSPYVSLNHAAQIGMTESHATYATVPQLQRQFLMLYAEWLARERTGADDKVWSIGFVMHPNHGDIYNDALVEYLEWLDTYFIGKLSPHGNTIARYATVGEIVGEFTTWERTHPHTSSFHYVKGDPYPYTFPTIATKLLAADYDATIDLGPSVSCYKFIKDGNPIYMLWSNQGDRQVDFSREISGSVLVTDPYGDEIQQDASKLKITETPILIE